MQHPSSITPEAAAWIQAQAAITSARSVAPLREHLDRTDNWMNGLFTVLLNVLPYLLREHPALALQLEPQWHSAAERFDQLIAGAPMEGDESPPDTLEARKMLYRILDLLGVWQQAHVSGQGVQWRRRSA